ncbi:MAG: helix-turn-helix transcriptional regulator [Candidatus Lariskella arthropodorum]
MENCFITPNPLDKLNLTARERDVLYWLIRLDSAKEIAKKMHKSHHTIYDIIGQIKNKLQVANIGELREKVFDTGLIHKLLK